MRLVIDIPEEDYNFVKKQVADGITNPLKICIANGIPLPKGHGRLIDADTLEGHSQIQIVPCGNGKYVEVMAYYQNDIDVAPTIIEADKGE